MNLPVLLPKIFNYPLTYESGKKINYKIGDLVEVPFGKKKEIGVIWDKSVKINKKVKIKLIEKKIHNFSINKDLIKFINLFSSYNLQPKGLILKMCIGNSKNFKVDKKIEFKECKIIKNNFELNKHQQSALENLKGFGENFNVSVLLGVTGSGKTIVYFERIKEYLKKGKQVLLMLPEIFLTNQFNERFSEFFGFKPYIWHSKISPKNKRYIWQGLAKGKIQIIIGARSSLLLPFKDLGLIVVDEEHDTSYKQEEGIIYNARDMAIARASIENIPIHLVTSIPSLETFKNIQNKKYKSAILSKRYKDSPFPKSKIINLNINKIKGNYIAEETINIVKKYLDENNQILFFLNRRGHSPLLICKKCGYKHICPSCSIYLTYHKLLNRLLCHHCGYKTNEKKICHLDKNDCTFLRYGPGIEKVYDELVNKFPNKNIKMFSSDYLFKKNSNKILQDITRKKIDILVGTQMISKGFNFPKLNCIVVVDADFNGKGYDLRAAEKNIQLYHQLSGRAGRFSNKSTIVYQTITPEHETLKDILINNPEKFLENELCLRKNNNLPPYKKLIALIVSSSDKEHSFRGAQEIKNKVSKVNFLEVLGPIESPIFKLKKKYRTRLLIRSKIDTLPQKFLAKILNNLKFSSKIKLTVDVDPINFT